MRATSLHWSGREAAVDRLIKFTNDKNITILGGDIALVKAASRGYIYIVKTFIELGSDVHSVACSETALAGASGNGHAKIVKFLVEAGADVKTKLKNGDTALGIAACNGQFKCVEALLNAGADVNHLEEYGWPILMSAASRGHVRCINYVAKIQKAGIFAKIPLRRHIGNHADRICFLRDKQPWMKRHIEAKDKDLFKEINDFLYVKHVKKKGSNANRMLHKLCQTTEGKRSESKHNNKWLDTFNGGIA